MSLNYTLVGNEAGEKNVTLYVEGRKPLLAHSTHPKFDAIVAGILADDASVADLFDLSQVAGQKFEKLSERVAVANGRVYFDGEELDEAISGEIVGFIEASVEDWKPLVAFIENVMQNPNPHSRENLYTWLVAHEITITESGLLVGYKGVEKDADGNLQSSSEGVATVDGTVFEGKIPNPIGAVVEMPRASVDHDPSNPCMSGLHVGTYQYAKGFASVLLEVHVNPRDIVNVPDASFKFRTCRYTVVQVIEDRYTSKVVADAKPAEQVAAEYDLRKGTIFEDTDARRIGRKLKVVEVEGDQAVVESNGKTTRVKIARLFTRKYKLVRKGRKPKA
jgi:hypothetical protein